MPEVTNIRNAPAVPRPAPVPQSGYAGNGKDVHEGDSTAGDEAVLRFIHGGYDIRIQPRPSKRVLSVKEAFRSLADELCEKHQSISTDKRIFKGMPHIRGVRLSVGLVLANLAALGSVDAVVEAYAPCVTREQVTEAIRFAKDFVEEACDPAPPHVDG